MKKLLVVVDMQADFVDGALGTPEAVAIVPNVAEKIREWNGDIVYTLDTHAENYMSTREGKYLPVPHCIKGTLGHCLNKAVADAAGNDPVLIEKPTFGSVELVEYVRAGGYDSIELIGLCTDICVVSNALLLKANFIEADIAVDAKCCAGVTPESHDAALSTMKMCQIDILN